MSENAEYMTNGIMCAECGAWLTEEGDVQLLIDNPPGYPRFCIDCAEDRIRTLERELKDEKALHASHVEMHNAAKQDWWTERERLERELADREERLERVLGEARTLINLHIRALGGDVAENVEWDSAVLALRSAVEREERER